MVTQNNTWCDPYPVVTWMNGKNQRESELPVFATQVIDGKGYRIAIPPDGREGLMKTYCIGPVKVIDGKSIMVEKPVAGVVTNHDVTTPEDVQPVAKPVLGNVLPPDDISSVENHSFATRKKGGRPKVVVPMDEILVSTEPSRILAKKYNVHYSTITRIRKGQQLLV